MSDKRQSTREERGISDYGVIYLSGQISDSTAESVSKEIIEYNLKGEIDQIQLIVNSCGGSCSAGFSIIDMMEWSRLPIYTTGLGMVASMGLLILMAGYKGRRVVTPRTLLLSHRFWGMNVGNHSQLIAGRRREDLEHSRIVQHYLQHSNIKSEQVLEEKLLRDVDAWLTPEEGVEFGLVDVIDRPSHSVGR